MQNAFVESFNGRLRDEFLNETLFTSLAQARAALEEWRRDYNTVRPHSRIGWLTPAAYAEQFTMQRGQGAALTTGSAPWPLTTDQTRSSTAKLWFQLDKSWGQRHRPQLEEEIRRAAADRDAPAEPEARLPRRSLYARVIAGAAAFAYTAFATPFRVTYLVW